MGISKARQKIRDNANPATGESYPSRRWDISDERAFIETLVNQRTGILLVVFSVVIGGAYGTSPSPLAKSSILTFGAFVCSLMGSTVWRSQKKLDIIFKLIKMDESHPLTVVDEIAGPSGSRRRIIGYLLPFIYAAVLIIAALVSWAEYLFGPQGLYTALT